MESELLADEVMNRKLAKISVVIVSFNDSVDYYIFIFVGKHWE